MNTKNKVMIIIMILLPFTALFSFDSDYLNRVTFINNTGADILYIFLSPGDSSEWGFDILGSERVLEDKNLLSFFITYPDYENSFDIMAIDEEGNTFIVFDEVISDDEEANIIISEGDLDDDNPGMEFVTVNFFNATDLEESDMYYVFVSPQDSQMWGVDMLDDETILFAGETLSLLAPLGEDEISYDVMCVDEDNREFTFTLNVHRDYADEYDEIDIPIEDSDLDE